MVLCLALVFLAVTLIGAAADGNLRQVRTTQCANHLRQLGAAAHAYADDHEGRFFYHNNWNMPNPSWWSKEWANWYDRERVGEYVDGAEEFGAVPRAMNASIRAAMNDPTRPKQHHGMGRSILHCPHDEGAARSYSQNFWSTGWDAKAKPPDGPSQPRGIFFTRDSVDDPDRMLLFGEGFALAPGWPVNQEFLFGHDRPWWLTAGTIGATGQVKNRFKPKSTTVFDSNWRWANNMTTLLDTEFHFGRHEEVSPFATSYRARLNFSFVDGSVDSHAWGELYHPRLGGNPDLVQFTSSIDE